MFLKFYSLGTYNFVFESRNSRVSSLKFLTGHILIVLCLIGKKFVGIEYSIYWKEHNLIIEKI